MSDDYQDQSNWRVSIWFYLSDQSVRRKGPQLILVSVQCFKFNWDLLYFLLDVLDVLDWKILLIWLTVSCVKLVSGWCIQGKTENLRFKHVYFFNSAWAERTLLQRHTHTLTPGSCQYNHSFSLLATGAAWDSVSPRATALDTVSFTSTLYPSVCTNPALWLWGCCSQSREESFSVSVALKKPCGGKMEPILKVPVELWRVGGKGGK